MSTYEYGLSGVTDDTKLNTAIKTITEKIITNNVDPSLQMDSDVGKRLVDWLNQNPNETSTKMETEINKFFDDDHKKKV